MATKGIQGATAERLALAERVRVLHEEEGLVYREIAQQLGISHSYASSLATDPDGSKTRARKDSYAGECVDCGAPTSGSNGSRAAANRCDLCSHALQHLNRRWTRDAVIDAIRRYHRAHGRPPRSEDWIRADQVHNYPPRSAVYRGGQRRGKHQPFQTWADAIEAAGFPRPHVGIKYEILREVTCPDCGFTEEQVSAYSTKLCGDCVRQHAHDAYIRRRDERRRSEQSRTRRARAAA